MKTLGLLLVAALALSGSYAVDKNNFKTCDQSGFCKRLRGFKPEKSQYTLNLDSVMVHGNVLSAEVNTVDTSTPQKTVLVSRNIIFNLCLKNLLLHWRLGVCQAIFVINFIDAVKSTRWLCQNFLQFQYFKLGPCDEHRLIIMMIRST